MCKGTNFKGERSGEKGEITLRDFNPRAFSVNVSPFSISFTKLLNRLAVNICFADFVALALI